MTGLKGRPEETPASKARSPGWHPVDWLCEFVGTAFQLFVGFGAVAAFESARSPLRSDLPGGVRLVVIGICFGLLAAAVATSPLGRRSGAHLNPAVTFGFFLRGHTSLRDSVGFGVAQTAGALVAAAGFAKAWDGWAATVDTARTQPAADVHGWAAASIEAALTCGLLLTIFAMLSSSRTARWTPAVVTGVLAGLIWAGAPYTGASMNPSRTIGPDVVTDYFPSLWSYLVGPLAGAAGAAGIFAVVARRRTLTAKLFHDARYPSVHASDLPARRHPRERSAAPQTAVALDDAPEEEPTPV
ncbi:MAG TPA: aquaporin [Acidimicrobiales bacterium]|nr:aquaporin [Acidimicrobiales bacterium]